MEWEAQRGVDWVDLPVIATVARLLCRELTLQNEYLLLENRTLKCKVPGRLRFTDEERRCPPEKCYPGFPRVLFRCGSSGILGT